MSEKKFPNPEEVQKEFEDFVKQRFGGAVQVFSHSMPGGEKKGTEEHAEDNDEVEDEYSGFDINFNLKPKDIKAHLDRFIIKQDEAKKALAIAVCDHYNHVKDCLKNRDQAPPDYAKQNVMILGPTGVGKTYMIRKIAELIGVPFIKADATRFSETGYVGANVDDLIRDLVTQADGNIALAQHGIVYLDEVDKLASSSSHHGRDVTGRGVQFGLLRLMEEAEVDLKSGNDIQSQIQAMMEFQRGGKPKKSLVNTANILFIVSGAFTGLEDLVKKRMNTQGIGFNAPRSSTEDTDEYLAAATTQDLIDFGFEPEFIGRLPVKVACHHLSEQDLFAILKDSQGSIIHQYERAFAAYDIQMDFKEEALRAISARAFTQKTGARALMTECEQIFRDYKFELPSSHVEQFTVTAETISDPKGYLQKVLSVPNNSELNKYLREILAVEQDFHAQHEITIKFTQEAAEAIAQKAMAEKTKPGDICEEILANFIHGLKLIHQNTGESVFELGIEVLENPQGYLEQLITQAFAHRSPPLQPSKGTQEGDPLRH